MSETTTGATRYAAVMHEPPVGPMATPSMASRYPCGRRGAAPCRRWVPCASSNKHEDSMSLDCSSTTRHKVSRMRGSASPLAIISSTRVSPASRASLHCRAASARLRSSMSVVVPYQCTRCPRSSRTGTARKRHQRYAPSTRRRRASASPGSPEARSCDQVSISVPRSSGWIGACHPQPCACAM